MYDTSSCAHACEYPAEVQCVANHGKAKGKECDDDLHIHLNLKSKFGNRHFGAEGYYVSTVGLNEATIAKNIREQDKYDQIMDKITTKELENPF